MLNHRVSHHVCLFLFFLFGLLPCITARDLPPGVAFSFTIDYGTAAIYFRNGTFAGVAQIEGSPEYKAFMRKNGSSIPETSFCDKMPLPLQQMSLDVCHRHPDSASSIALLRALRSAVTAYLGTGFCYVDIALPDPPSQVYQRGIIEQAIKSIGLRQIIPAYNARKLAVYANNIPSPDVHAPDRVVLAIDFSRSGLNIGLFCEYQNIVDGLRESYRPDLGFSSVPEKWTAIKETLIDLVKLPFGHSLVGEKLPDHIDQLVLHGDMVSSKQFLIILEEIVGKDLVEKALEFELIFPPAIGQARSSIGNIDDIDFNVKPGFGCSWGSKYYQGRRIEYEEL